MLKGSTLSISFLATLPGVTLIPETSTDLRNWTTDNVTLSEIGEDNRRTVSISSDAGERYLRLRIGDE